MKYSYSHKADTVYISFAEKQLGDVVRTESLDPSGHLVNLDFTDSGRLLGIEVMDASVAFAQDFLDAARQIDVD